MWLNPLEYPRENIRKINLPVLIILGDTDEVLPVEEGVKMFRMIPDAELAIIPRADHLFVLSKAELFNTVVTDFLLRHCDAGT
ncbi:MAG: alpha/beta fold hydrolase [Candidatus Heimdallarchaeota archaeon]